MATSGPGAVDVLARLDAAVGECPVFDDIDGALYTVDIPAGRVWRCAPDGTTAHVDIGQPVGCVALVAGGGFLLGTRAGVARLPAWDATPEPWIPLEPHLPTQCNDGRCDPRGRFVVGTATTDRSADGALYLIDHDGAITRLIGGVGMSNGIDWSPDESTAYYVDSVAGTVTRYPWDAEHGRVGPGTVIVALDPDDGLPDGLTVDDEGMIWLAVWGAGEVRRFDPAGRRLATITFPTPQVTSCAFGGPARDRLYVTSARAGLPPDDAGHDTAGSVFVAEPGATGPPPTRFRPGPR